MTTPERLNTDLEAQVLRQGRIENFGARRVRISEKDPKLSLAVAGMRRVFDEDPREKSSPAGVIYISRYMAKSNREVDESTLERGGIDEAERLWIPYKEGYPSAIRGAGKVEEAYLPGGREYESIRAVRDYITDVLRRFQRGQIRTEDAFTALTKETAGVMVREGFDTPVKPDKEDVSELLERTLELTDSLGRFNPSRSRMLYGYALAHMQRLFMFEPYPREKYGNLKRKNLRAYSVAATNLEETKNTLMDFGNTPARSPEYRNMARTAKRFVSELLSDTAVSAKPLRRAALIARLGILGPQSGNEIDILKEMGQQRAVIEVFHENAIEFEPGGKRADIIGFSIRAIEEDLKEAEERLAGTYVEQKDEPTQIFMYGRKQI